MITYSIIKRSELEGALRLDAEYYQPEYLDLYSKLKNQNSKLLEEIAESVVSFGAYSLTNYIEWEESGVPYLNVEDIRDGRINFDGTKFISERVDEILKKSRVREGQVIITMAGTIGEAAVAHKIPKRVNSNQATAKITLKQGLSPYYLAAFLNSYFGKKQTEREIVSSVQPNIFLGSIKNLRVFMPASKQQETIEKTYKLGLDEYENSKSFYSQAENLLLGELGLGDFKIEDDLSFAANLSEIKSSHRADAEYFQPKYDKLILRLKGQSIKPLINVIENMPARFNPNSKPDETFHYVELANINSSIGIIDGFSEVLGKEAPSRAKRILKVGDVIVSSVEGSLEKVALVNKEQEGNLASTGFFQFRSKEILPEVLLVLSKSIVLKMQLEKQCAGTILAAVPQDALKNIFVPILSKPAQEKIADLVRKSHQARKKSKELLEEAKRKVEEIIEKGGE